MNDNTFIIPIFSSTIFTSFLDTNFDDVYDHMIKTEKIRKTNYGYGSEIGVDNHLLDRYLPLKKEIFNKFLQFKDDVLKLESTNFKISTSWITKFPPGTSSQKHFHSNSCYSGVLYLTDHTVESPLMFFNPMERFRSIKFNDPSEYNIFNSSTWKVFPEKNKIIFFPSYLEHKILNNTSSTDRYSIAFNLFIFGTVGEEDSLITLNF